MLDIDSLAVDPAAAEEGVWATFMGAKFRIARHNCEAANQLRSRLTMEQWDALIAGDEKSDLIAEEVNVKTLATAVLLDWNGVGTKDKEIKYTPEIGVKYLSDQRFRDLRQFIENYSLNRANYRERAEAEIAEQVKDSAAS